MDFEEKLNQLYSKINSADATELEQSNYYYSLLEIKRLNKDYKNFGHSAYQDAKGFISCYINSSVYRDLGYDVINIEKILNSVSSQFELKERYLLAKFAYRVLRSNSFENESNELMKSVNGFKTQLLRSEDYRVGKFVKIFLHKTTYSIWTILLVLLSVFTISFLVLLPAPIEKWKLFEITYHSYSDSFLLNHFWNLLSSPLEMNDDFTIEAKSGLGVLVIFAIKSFYVIFIANFLYAKLNNLLKGD